MADHNTWREFAELQNRALKRGCFPGERAWLHWDGVSIYVRFAKTVDGGRLVPTLQLASIEAETPGQGAFTRLLPEIEKANRLDVIEIENVLERRFADFLERQGYEPRPLPGMPSESLPCPFRKTLK